MPSTASGEGQKDGKFSSLLGDFTPITEQSSQPKAESRYVYLLHIILDVNHADLLSKCTSSLGGWCTVVYSLRT
jgi:hypothetical protein